ncbi:hypothetical protein N9W89_02840 [Hellea sp.]|nr:hypothetical protein [Hellea sp.]
MPSALALKLALPLAAFPLLFGHTHASTVTLDSERDFAKVTRDTPTHTIFLNCQTNSTKVTQSKASILALPDGVNKSKHDFALVTGHGLINGHECNVRDFQGHKREVIGRVYAKNYKSGTDTDWAIISFKPIKGNHIIRYKTEDYVRDKELLHNMDVSFAQARGLPQNNQNCRLAVVNIPTPKNDRDIYSHDCVAVPGQSGSPITQSVNGEDRLLGFHLGQVWTVKSPITKKPGNLYILRPFDEDMSLEINQAITQLSKG